MFPFAGHIIHGPRDATARRPLARGGAILVGLGLLFMRANQLGLDVGRIGWAVFVIGPGVALLPVAVIIGGPAVAGLPSPAGS